MNSNETKIDAIINAVSQEIEAHEKAANDAMGTLEKVNSSPEEYRNASILFGLNSYVANYLKRIKDVVMERDIKKAENVIRFHSYYQHTKGSLSDGNMLSACQAAVMATLDSYISRFFEA